MTAAICTAALYVCSETTKQAENVMDTLFVGEESYEVFEQATFFFSLFNHATQEGLSLKNLVNLHFATIQLRGAWGDEAMEGEDPDGGDEDDLNRKVIDLLG